jgi:hypothetical protein
MRKVKKSNLASSPFRIGINAFMRERPHGLILLKGHTA